MAEVIGLVASCATLCHLVTKGAGLFRSMQRMQMEMNNLVDQINAFRDTVQAIQAVAKESEASSNSMLGRELSRVESTIQELNDLITTRLARHSNRSARFKRRLWLRHWNEIARLRDELKAARKSLNYALQVQAHIDSRDFRLGFARVESKLAVMSRRLTFNQSNVEGKKNTQSANQQTVESYERTATPLVQPAGILELSPWFRPARCTTEDGIPNLFSHSNRQTLVTESVRVNQCDLFYRKDRGQWIRLSLIITTSLQSSHWSLARSTTGVRPLKAHPCVLPKEVKTELETFLNNNNDIGQDDRFHVGLRSPSDQSPIEITTIRHAPTSSNLQYLRGITECVRHWNIPWFWEAALDHRPVSRFRPDGRFFAYLNRAGDARWLLELRFGSDQEQMECVFHNLQVLHRLCDSQGKAAPGINQLAGVVYDKKSGLLNAVLCEIPVKGRLSKIVMESDPPPSWDRRLKWCRQILQGVSEMHRRECFAGGLGTFPDWTVGIDSHDRAVLYRFWPRVFYGPGISGMLPPELRQPWPVSQTLEATASTDVYQLGLLLWRIAGGHNNSSPQSFCELAGHIDLGDRYCVEPHTDPVQLPPTGGEVPAILTDIIAACRADNPNSRPPAWELLKRMEVAHELSPSRNTTRERRNLDIWLGIPPAISASPLQRPEGCVDRFGDVTLCDHCGRRTVLHLYHCDVCNLADFDICPECFSKGRHCNDDTHYLREFCATSTRDKYYTSLRNGERTEIVA